MEKQNRLLVCAKDNSKRREIVGLLDRIGFTVVDEAGDASEGERMLCEKQYALVISETSGSGVNMMQLAFDEGRRASGMGLKGAEFLFVGERNYEDVISEICRFTGASYILRPFSIHEFYDAVFGALSSKKGNDSVCTYRDYGYYSKNEEAKEDNEEPEEVQITSVLHTLGIPAHIKGFSYLRCAIGLTMADPDMLNYVTKSLYPTVAKTFSTTTSRVERAIRHAIEVAWDRGDIETLNRYFGYTISRQRGKPTNSEFIAMISDRLRLAAKR